MSSDPTTAATPQSQQPQQTPPVVPCSYMYQAPPEDEIDLLDLLRVLMCRWKTIALITLMATSLAIAYAFWAPKVYKTKVILLPPKVSDVEPLNVLKGDGVGVDTLYKQVLINLNSSMLRKSFFREYGLFKVLASQNDKDISEELVFENQFNKVLMVQPQNKKELNFFNVTLEGSDPDYITQWINDFVAQVNAYTVQEQVQVVGAKLANQKEYTLNQIAGLRNVAKDQRLDQVAVLEEAVFIARKLGFINRQQGIVEREYTGVAMATNRGTRPDLGVVASTTANPIYLRGVNELQAEIDMLNNRKNDDPFINELRQLEGKLAELDNVILDTAQISAVSIDQPALAPAHAIKPKRKLIVVLGFVVGLMGGIFLAFLLSFIESSRAKLMSKDV